MQIVVITVALFHLAAEAVDGEVHLGEVDGLAGFLLALDEDPAVGGLPEVVFELFELVAGHWEQELTAGFCEVRCTVGVEA
jgi:hypothetical protein